MLDMNWELGKVAASYVNIVQLQVYLPGIARIQLYTTLLELHTLLL
jgi:hypothetical protein